MRDRLKFMPWQGGLRHPEAQPTPSPATSGAAILDDPKEIGFPLGAGARTDSST